MKRILILALLSVVASAGNSQQTVDVREFGTFAAYSSNTASTTVGQPIAYLDDAQSFKNGEYVTIFHAGPPCQLSVPGAPVITPSVNAGGLETISARSGSTGFAYEIVAADKFGCYTAASVPGSTSAGNALGVQTVSIISGTRTDNLQTVETAKSHGLVVGLMIYIKYFSTNDASFEGTWEVYSVRMALEGPERLGCRLSHSGSYGQTPTHFTFLSSLDTRAGASTSFTSGTVIDFRANKISWTAVPGAWKYYIYGRTGGKFTRIGQTLFPYWVDYGSPMNDNQTFPAWIPTTAPSVEANDHLTTRIVSRGGTKTLTLRENVGASLSGAPLRSDDGPALKIATSQTNGGKVHIPPAGIILNSYTQLNKRFFTYNLEMAGSA